MMRRIYELLIALTAIVWGGWLISPIDTFGSTPTARVFHNIAPEWVWGVVMVATGTHLLLAIWRDKLTMRRLSLVMLSLLWLAIWAIFVLGNWRSTATVIYLFWVILCAVSYWKAGRNGVVAPQL